MKQGVLHDLHLSLGARMTEFAGWTLPLSYGSILDEVRAVRSRAGLFDVSHMGRIEVGGHGAGALLQRLTTNDIGRLEIGHGRYTMMCNSRGGIIDDMVVFRTDTDRYIMVVNAANTQKDLDRLTSYASDDVAVNDLTWQTSFFALQGPLARAVLAAAAETVPELFRFGSALARIAGNCCSVSRTGYTGEDGYEIGCSNSYSVQVWETLRTAGGPSGLAPCGLGARDVLRIEAGYVLYGRDIDEDANPIEAGLSRFVRMEKGEFVGREALQGVLEQGPDRLLVGVRMEDRSVPRPGAPILANGATIGQITSGTFSPTIGRGIGLGYIAAEKSLPGLEVELVLREKAYPGRVVATPFLEF
ncbi:MAG: glycine cleavage system aminomethyltransferase GcvT [Armatimonadota bacterium]|nr:glycine cleavage system aminomethyltransferase GcvT [Armatimonadota bacterium]